MGFFQHNMMILMIWSLKQKAQFKENNLPSKKPIFSSAATERTLKKSSHIPQKRAAQKTAFILQEPLVPSPPLVGPGRDQGRVLAGEALR